MMIENCTKPLQLSGQQYDNIAKEIQKIIDVTTTGSAFFNLSDNSMIVKVTPNDITRVFAERFEGLLAFRNLILSSLLKIDKLSPVCSLLYLDSLASQIAGEPAMELPPMGFRISSHDFFKSWGNREITGLGDVHDNIIIQSVKDAGSRGAVKVNCAESNSTSTSSGCKFDLLTPDGFFVNNDKMRLQNCSILVYQGSINEVSQIHHILEQSSSPLRNMIIFATSFSREVAYTLAKNLEIDKLSILPIVIPDAVENINDIHDISFLTNSIPITEENGGSLRTVEVNRLPVVDLVKADFVNSTLRLDIEHQAVSSLRKVIAKQIHKEEVEDKKDIFKKRMSRLMSHNVHVELKADKCLEGIIQDRVSFFITTLSSIARENCIESNKLTVKNTENLPEFVPYFSAKYAIKRASSDSSFILNTGMVIATDNE